MVLERKNKYYKVVTKDMKSLGLRKNPNIMTYRVGKWKYENPDNINYQSSDFGGIWVANGLSQARGLVRYLKKKSMGSRIFLVEIGDILYQNNYRLKTDKVKLIKEI